MNKKYVLYYFDEIGPQYIEKIIYDFYNTKEEAKEAAKELNSHGIDTTIERES